MTISRTLLAPAATEEWSTPDWLFARLDAVFNFSFDLAATAENSKCADNYFSKEQDSLKQQWRGLGFALWLNPPYGRGIGKWLKKAHEESSRGCIVVCLVPARTCTRWWHEWVQGKAQITFIRGRVRFGDSGKDAPFPNAILVYGLDLDRLLNSVQGKAA